MDHRQIDDDLTRGGQGFIVLAEAPPAAQPAERTLHDPAVRQEREASNALRPADNAKQVNRFLDGKLPADDPAARHMTVFLKAVGLGLRG
jgi:hypothetical protein